MQAVLPDTRTEVQLYADEAPAESRKIRGRFHSATADAVTLTLEDRQMRTVPKSAVRKVLTRRPFLKRTPGWIAAGVSGGLTVWFSLPEDIGPDGLLHLLITAPVTAIAFLLSPMGGIYEGPPERRAPPPKPAP